MNTFKIVVENWYFIAALIAVIAVAYFSVRKFLSLPNTAKKQKIIAWMIYAVKVAEDRFGSGTGVIKLGFVYDMFVKKFSIVSKIITFEQFKSYVNEALKECENALENANTEDNKNEVM